MDFGSVEVAMSNGILEVIVAGRCILRRQYLVHVIGFLVWCSSPHVVTTRRWVDALERG
jgi:hypothetical protein